RVARISFNNTEVADLIAAAWMKVGVEGVLSTEKSGTNETTVEFVDGIKFLRGYSSPYMVNDGRRMVAQVEKPHILLTTYRLTEMEDIRKPMEVLAANNIRSLVIVCDGIEGNALATVIANSVHNPNRETPPFHVVAVTLPI